MISPSLDERIDEILDITRCTCYHEGGCDATENIEQAKQEIKALVAEAKQAIALEINRARINELTKPWEKPMSAANQGYQTWINVGTMWQPYYIPIIIPVWSST